MKAILNRCIIGAVVLTNVFLAASTPIPLTGSGLLSVKLFNGDDKVPDASRDLQFDLENEGELGLLARDPTDEDNDSVDSKPTPNPITIPHVFRPAGTSSEPELKMTIPRITEHTCWGSVLNIIHLIDAAAERDTNLKGPRDTFVQELTTTAALKVSLKKITQRIERLRPTALHMQETTELDLETILDHIETAVKKHNEFQADIKIPIGFFPNENLGMKVPYPKNVDAVNSVKVILRLLRSATGSNTENLMVQLVNFKKTLSLHYELALPNFQRQHHTRLTVAKFTACQELIRKAIERHNNNDWVEDDQFVIPEFPDDENYYQPPPTQDNLKAPQIPKIFFIQSTSKKSLHLSIPRRDDKDGKESVNQILDLMALVGGSPNLQKSWNTFRDNLNRQLEVIEKPQAWGPLGEEGADTRKQAVVDAIKTHNGRLRVKNRSKEVLDPGQKRPADGPHERVPGPRHETGQGTGTTKTSLEAPHKTPPLQPQPDSEGEEENEGGDILRKWTPANVLPDGTVEKWTVPPHLQRPREDGGRSGSGSNTTN
ncbi:hypothetical protein H0H93_007299 [Arthromyces matolae]|nr:hypothetical protein H0H93_007299 [Arthromyces matolae]